MTVLVVFVKMASATSNLLVSCGLSKLGGKSKANDSHERQKVFCLCFNEEDAITLRLCKDEARIVDRPLR